MHSGLKILRYVLGLNQLIGAICFIFLFFNNFSIEVVAPYWQQSLIDGLLITLIMVILPCVIAGYTLWSGYEIIWKNKYGKATVTSLALQIPYISSSFFGYYMGLGLSWFLSWGASLVSPSRHEYFFESLFRCPVNFLTWIDDPSISVATWGVNVISIALLIFVFSMNKKSSTN